MENQEFQEWQDAKKPPTPAEIELVHLDPADNPKYAPLILDSETIGAAAATVSRELKGILPNI